MTINETYKNLSLSALRAKIAYLSLEEIINRDLIAISISKAFKYVVVRNKIREQIITGINYKNSNSNILIIGYQISC